MMPMILPVLMSLLVLFGIFTLVFSIKFGIARGPVMMASMDLWGMKITPERMFLLGLTGIVGGIAGSVYLW